MMFRFARGTPGGFGDSECSGHLALRVKMWHQKVEMRTRDAAAPMSCVGRAARQEETEPGGQDSVEPPGRVSIGAVCVMDFASAPRSVAFP